MENPNDVLKTFNTADIINCKNNNRIVFNVSGNKYRLICGYYFGETFIQLFVKFAGTHEEYNLVDVCKIEMYKKMKNLKYTIIKNQEQYNKYCEMLEDLIISKKSKVKDEIELLTLLIHDYNERIMENYQYEFTPVELLKNLISENKLTQLELAKRLKVSPQLISDIIKRRREISKNMAYKLADEFSINMLHS